MERKEQKYFLFALFLPRYHIKTSNLAEESLYSSIFSSSPNGSFECDSPAGSMWMIMS